VNAQCDQLADTLQCAVDGRRAAAKKGENLPDSSSGKYCCYLRYLETQCVNFSELNFRAAKSLPKTVVNSDSVAVFNSRLNLVSFCSHVNIASRISYRQHADGTARAPPRGATSHYDRSCA